MRASTRSGEGIAPHRSGVDTRRRWRRCEWHRGELYPCVGFIVTNMTTSAERVVAFYNQRGTAGHWIKDSKKPAVSRAKDLICGTGAPSLAVILIVNASPGGLR